MSVELLQTIALVAYILAGVLFVIAVVLFFILNVPKLYGDITGSIAKKAIENIRQQNESTGNKAYKPSPVNASRGKITEKISGSGELENKYNSVGVSVETERIDNYNLSANGNETTILLDNQPANETTILSENQYANETTILSDNQSTNETTVLSFDNNSNNYHNEQPIQNSVFSVDAELEFCGSTDIIE